ncbi:MAG TPA: glutathione S-transferase N-terminal domain-containing protein, partial [Candidatus Acidoferrales bacterium]|nr:glutathione S-transferase N-terminal domain-containing protein [Candidatus Acidoferrales bacterium]
MADFVIWGSELSPFALKLRALCDYARLPYRWLPADGSRLENYRIALTIDRAKRRRTALRYPQTSALDEYPLVPFLVEEGRRVLYDSSALAHWLDDQHAPALGPLFPRADPALAFVAQLIDESFDELGLYLVHHNRWVLSARTNNAGERLAHEFRNVMLPGTLGAFGRRFARRQVRRLPYLFSVAPSGFCMPDWPSSLTPPARQGFPATHGLLGRIWERHLNAMETVLRAQPFLLGERFTIADASAYGQLGMNLADPTAAERMRQLAPTTFTWLCSIRDRGHIDRAGDLQLTPVLRPLLQCIVQAFVPLMRQNAAAYEAVRRTGETLFNEAAFDSNRSLYRGILLDEPFRSVAKSFQVQVWRELST